MTFWLPVSGDIRLINCLYPWDFSTIGETDTYSAHYNTGNKNPFTRKGMKIKGELTDLESYETTVWASQAHTDRAARIKPEDDCQILEKSLLCCVCQHSV